MRLLEPSCCSFYFERHYVYVSETVIDLPHNTNLMFLAAVLSHGSCIAQSRRKGHCYRLRSFMVLDFRVTCPLRCRAGLYSPVTVLTMCSIHMEQRQHAETAAGLSTEIDRLNAKVKELELK